MRFLLKNIDSLNIGLFLRYLAVGIIAYISEMGSLFILHSIINLSPINSVAISFWIGLAVAFALQKIITFKNYQKSIKILSKQLLLYFLLVAWNYFFSLLIVTLFAQRISVFLVRTATIAIIICWNFVLYKYIFKH